MTDDRKRPAFNLNAKPKQGGGKARRLFTLWPGKFGGYNATPEKPWKDRPGVAAILLTDGTRIDLEQHWLNVDPADAPPPKKEDDDSGDLGF